MNIDEVNWCFENQDVMNFHREGESVIREVAVNVLGTFFKDRGIHLNEVLTEFIDGVEASVKLHTWWLRRRLIEDRYPFAIDDLKKFILRNIHIFDAEDSDFRYYSFEVRNNKENFMTTLINRIKGIK